MEPASPYSAPAQPGPESVAVDLERKTRFWKRASWVSLILVIIPPSLGLVGTVVGMIKAFNALGDHRVVDPTVLSEWIGEALIATATGLFISLPCLVFFVISLVKYFSYRRKWRRSPASQSTP